MKTIAISIDEPTLAVLDDMVKASAETRANRSLLIRKALQEFIRCHQKKQREQHERQILARHRDRIRREAEALIKEQAQP